MHTYTLLVLFGWVCVAYVQAKPWYCREYACPDFTTKTSGGEYDVRTFTESTWLTTSVTSSTEWPSKQQKRSMFFKLFPYFMPKNPFAKKIPMAVPALFKVEKKGGNYKITMMFYVTIKNPPTPRKSGTSLVTMPARDVYVREFSQVKWPEDSLFDTHVGALKAAITDTSSFNGDVFYRASYNYPFDKKNKQHEVWIDQV